MNLKKIAPFLLLLLLVVITLIIKREKNEDSNKELTPKSRGTTTGLNRNPASINYSKHARCRMACRQIDEAEIKDTLRKGTINYKKSDLKGAECKKKYAVELYSKDKQHLRVIFAPCQDEVTVVTCIDLDKEWQCDCP